MVGMENIEVRSQDYILRWLPVNAGNTISWSIHPNKKHLNFGIVKRPELTPSTELAETATTSEKDKKKAKFTKIDDSTAYHTLESKGYKWVQWTGRLDPDKVHVGTYNVMEGESGNYALVFDNTFSKNASKSATIVLMTYPTNSPPTSGHHLHFSHTSAANSTTDVAAKHSPALNPAAASSESIPHDLHSLKSVAADPRPRSKHAVETKSFGGSSFYTGVMLKRRRKHNNYANRFFSLDFTTGTLSYYQNRHSSALRGAIPLGLAVVTTNEATREINVDSGAETWHLRLKNQKDYTGWRDALDRATATAAAVSTSLKVDTQSSSMPPPVVSAAFIRDWERIETLVSKISGIRDAVRRLAKDTDPKYLPSIAFGNRSAGVSPTRSPSEGSFDFAPKEEEPAEKRPFWKRKVSGNTPTSSSILNRTGSAGRIPTLNSGPVPVPNGRVSSFPGKQYLSTSPEALEMHSISNIHNSCMEILQNLDETVADFSGLVAQSRLKRQQSRAVTRKNSFASNDSDEFFDAHDGTSRSQILVIPNDTGESDDKESFLDVASDTDEDIENIENYSRRRTMDDDNAMFPRKAKTLVPLPLSKVERREKVQPPTQAPPSLIAFLRKNVGKDFANIAMPASANEPTSALQRTAEQLEYSELLDSASANSDAVMRLLYVTAFAISSFSNNRVKERAIRKPFNPMLGETFELVREDKGFRLIAEKICHRPVQLALQADAENWSFIQAAIPTSKFWGKSAELNTQGRARVFLHEHSEVYSYTQATSFLRNVIAGEKYIEPVSTMTILCETSGTKAVVTFKAGGMFAGRSEEVSVQSFDNRGIDTGEGLAGKWTSHLNVTSRGQDTGNTIWRVAALLPDASSRYGFTEFAAQMNEITQIEKGNMPVTDSRLRPDQHALEECDYDGAESLKARLEERQRQRRRVLEEHGKEWSPRWFYMSGNDGEEDVWRLKIGKEGYWEQREAAKWTNVVDVFEI